MAPKSDQTQLTTHAQNVTTLPGQLINTKKRKCHTKVEIEADKQVAEEAKAAKEARKLAGIKRITNLEPKMDQDDANDVTPKSKSMLCKPQPL